VLRLVARGLSHKQIAEPLVISRKTASNHVEHIYAKIGVANRAMAALFAMKHGLMLDVDADPSRRIPDAELEIAQVEVHNDALGLSFGFRRGPMTDPSVPSARSHPECRRSGEGAVPMTDERDVTVPIVYHSGFGHTRVQAEAVHDGAASVAGTSAVLVAVEDIESSWHVVDRADAIVFGTPTDMAGPSAESNTDADPDVAPGPSDRRTAAPLGARVAEAAASWRAGLLEAIGAVSA
jgi:hypothetical protein